MIFWFYERSCRVARLIFRFLISVPPPKNVDVLYEGFFLWKKERRFLYGFTQNIVSFMIAPYSEK